MRASSSSLRPVISSPAIVISPSSATSSPATRFSSVDLPQPDGPMIATNSPARDVEVDAAQRAHRRELGLERLADARAPCTRHPSSDSLPVVSVSRYATHRRLPSLHHAARRAARASGGVGERRERSARSARSCPAGRARSCSRCARFTVSPTSVYSSRSSEPSSAAATSPVDRPMPSPNAGSPSARHCSLTACLALVHRARRLQRAVGVVVLRERRAEHGHHRVADVLHHGAALGEDRVVHLGAVRVELPGEHGRVGALGDARVAAHVGHQHGDVEPLGLADRRGRRGAASRRGRPGAAGSASRPAPRGRRSPSAAGAAGAARPRARRSLPSRASGTALRSRRSRLRAWCSARAAIAFTGRPSAIHCSSWSSRSSSSPSARAGATSASTIAGSSMLPPVATSRTARHELVAVADAVLQQVRVPGGAVGQQRDRVLGLVVLREHDDAGAGVALAHELGRLDALVLEARRHADVGDDDLRRGSRRRRATRPSKSSATPTTSRSGCAASRARTPSRTISESSARNTVIRGVVTERLDPEFVRPTREGAPTTGWCWHPSREAGARPVDLASNP